jgi:hypothetical protein
MHAELSGDGLTVTVQVPMTFRRRGGRKRVVTPDGMRAWGPNPARIDSTVVKALARAHRWRAMLEGGTYGCIGELAAAEKINPSYVSRVLRLTLLAPNVVDAILDGRADHAVSLDRLMRPFPVDWDQQVF